MSTSLRSQLVRAQTPGRIAHGWRVAELLEQGDWTCIYRAHPAGGGAVAGFAVKQARPDLATEREHDLARGLLLREAAVGNHVRHRNLAATLEVVRHGDEIWLVQPALTGTAPSAGRDVDLPLTLWIIRQTAQALAALHAARCLHGNVSTGAIVVGPAGHATLGELGWCRQLGSDECDLSRTPFLGQIAYAAPEMFDDAGMLTPAADVYSLGAVLVELLTGYVPFADYDGPEMIAAKRLRPAPEIRSAAIPYDVSSLAARMCSRDPLRRPTAREAIDTLIAAEVSSLAHSFSPR
jgi:serine/threonine-protein kinase